MTGSTSLRPIADVAADIGLGPDTLLPFGLHTAKVRLDAISPRRPGSKYVVVTSINPTPLGEGKTTTAIALAQGFWKIGVPSVVTIRQPSQGPLFGIKGGGAGGGKSTIEPVTELNLHLTGDTHAVTAAHNLCSAFLDNTLHHDQNCQIDQVTWRRVLDVNDRALRSVTLGRGKSNGPQRESGFDITAASEVMSIISVASDWQDMRTRLARIVVGYASGGSPVTTTDIAAPGPMAVLLRDAMLPNLLQTQEGTPAIVHTGPFGNIALGNSSIVADRLALGQADVVITESGFGTDLGAEKFFNVKCRMSGLTPDVAVVVVTCRAIKAHESRTDSQLDDGAPVDELSQLEGGLPNLAKHIENVQKHGVRVVVAINSYPADLPTEVMRLQEFALASGAEDCVVSTGYLDGGEGAVALARAVSAATERGSDFHYLYNLMSPAREKIETIAREMYGAGSVSYQPAADEALTHYEQLGYGLLPICMAKTPASLTGDPEVKGRPEGFELEIRDVRLAAGAGYLIPLVGNILLMPGLGKHPGGADMDLLADGTIVGMSH